MIYSLLALALVACAPLLTQPAFVEVRLPAADMPQILTYTVDVSKLGTIESVRCSQPQVTGGQPNSDGWLTISWTLPTLPAGEARTSGICRISGQCAKIDSVYDLRAAAVVR